MSFSPFITTIGGLTLQVMQAGDENIPDLLVLERQVYSGHTPWSKFSFETELKKVGQGPTFFMAAPQYCQSPQLPLFSGML